MKKLWFYDTTIGRLGFGVVGDAITDLLLRDRALTDGEAAEETPLHREAHRQLCEYLKGERQTFDLPLAPMGSEFQMQVWKALQDIPYGETRSYKDIAVAVGQPKGSQAVGQANNKNPIAIIIPCHRVMGKDGRLVGFGGGLDMQRRLLKLEGMLLL